VATTWEIAPPVSLPTKTTSVSSSASRNSSISAETPSIVTLVPSRIGSEWAPSGQVGAMHLSP